MQKHRVVRKLGVKHSGFVGLICVLAAAKAVSATTLTTIASFDLSTTGTGPGSSLTIDGNGNLYGTNLYGGPYGNGTVFTIDSTDTLHLLASFNGTNGGHSYGSLIEQGNNLYGTAQNSGLYGGGTAFEIDPVTGVLNPLTSFVGSSGANPASNLVADSHGNFYGTTLFGGTDDTGIVFKMDSTGAVTNLASFTGSNGANPQGALTSDKAGNLFGTTFSGGVANVGTLFEFVASTGTINTLATFNEDNGAYPYAGVISDSVGNLYGTTENGGTYGYGTVFMFDVSTGTLKTLVSFDESDGNVPLGSLILDAAGNLYGTTAGGGANNDGTVFMVNANTDQLTTLLSFDRNAADGYDPNTGLVADASGNLYGTTSEGGGGGAGTVFKLTGAGFVVPEPATLGLTGLGMLALGRRRARPSV